MHCVSPIRLVFLILTVTIFAPADRGAAAQTPTQIPPAQAPIVISRPPPLERGTEKTRKHRWSGRGEVSYVATTGNADTTTAQVGGETIYKPGQWSALFRAGYLTSTKADGTRDRRIDGLVRASREVSAKLELFGQIAYVENTYAGLSHSFYPLAGIAYELLAGKPHSLTTRVGLGYGQESRVRTRDLSFATADAETAYRWTMSKTAELRQDTTFTTNLSHSSDWRVANVTSVAAALNSALKLKVSHGVNYLNEPVSGFERVDTVTSASVVATF
jgi:putative salt-induced outer membrane protein YdiY